jgi:hypothetical protein
MQVRDHASLLLAVDRKSLEAFFATSSSNVKRPTMRFRSAIRGLRRVNLFQRLEDFRRRAQKL